MASAYRGFRKNTAKYFDSSIEFSSSVRYFLHHNPQAETGGSCSSSLTSGSISTCQGSSDNILGQPGTAHNAAVPARYCLSCVTLGNPVEAQALSLSRDKCMRTNTRPDLTAMLLHYLPRPSEIKLGQKQERHSPQIVVGTLGSHDHQRAAYGVA